MSYNCIAKQKNSVRPQVVLDVHVCAQLCPTLCYPMDYSPPAPLFMEFSRQEYWSGLPFHAPGDLPDPGIEPMPLASPALAGRFFTTSATWEAQASSRA